MDSNPSRMVQHHEPGPGLQHIREPPEQKKQPLETSPLLDHVLTNGVESEINKSPNGTTLDIPDEEQPRYGAGQDTVGESKTPARGKVVRIISVLLIGKTYLPPLSCLPIEPLPLFMSD